MDLTLRGVGGANRSTQRKTPGKQSKNRYHVGTLRSSQWAEQLVFLVGDYDTVLVLIEVALPCVLTGGKADPVSSAVLLYLSGPPCTPPLKPAVGYRGRRNLGPRLWESRAIKGSPCVNQEQARI